MDWFQELKDEHENIRAALEWADQTDVEAGLLISSSLHWFWENFQLLEGNYWLPRFLKKPNSHNFQGARARALCMYGWNLVGLQQSEAAVGPASESLSLFRALGDPRGEADALLLLAELSSDPVQKRELTEQALELAQSLGDARRTASALWQSGWLHADKDAFVFWDRAIALNRLLGNWRILAGSLSTMGFLLVLNGELESAQKYLDESNDLYRRFHLYPPPTHLLAAYGQLALIRGELESARAYLQESLRINEEIGSRQAFLWTEARLGYVALHERNLAEARRCFHEVAEGFRRDKFEIGIVYAVEGMLSLAVLEGKLEAAASLIGWANATREKLKEARPLAEQTYIQKQRDVTAAQTGESRFEREYEWGRKMRLEEALSLAWQA
jgi:tetratricopeptide (TPR) repeat protein